MRLRGIRCEGWPDAGLVRVGVEGNVPVNPAVYVQMSLKILKASA